MSVALLLSTFNGERFLPEQLASLTAQTHRDWVLYWRDDGSTDATPRLMRGFVADLPEGSGVALDDPGRWGPTESFLRLLRRAASAHEWVAFVDQDDVWRPEKLARAVARLQTVKRGRPALYCSRQVLVDAALRPLGQSPVVCRSPGFPAALIQNVATGCTVVMNREAAMLVAGSVAPAATFHDWWCYLVVAALGGEVVADEAAPVLYRQHAENAVGAPAGRFGRGFAALRRGPGPFMTLLRQHVAALLDQPELAAPAARQQLRVLEQGLGGRWKERLRVLRMPGLRRQTALETALFRIWFMVG